MRLSYRQRLLIDVIMALLLLFSFSYYWFGNTVHEIVGAVFFICLSIHVAINRRRFPHHTKKLDTIVTWLLFIVMTVLMVTSLFISQTQYEIFKINGGFNSRQIHAASAYWALLIVSLHLGLRWKAVSRFFLNNISHSTAVAMRVLFAILALQGIRSSFTLGIGGKLLMTPTLEWWDFNESPYLFFFHCIAVSVLYIFVTHHVVSFFNHQEEVA